MKKLLVSIMLVILMMTSSVLTACGGGGDEPNAAIDYSKTIVFYSTQGDSLQKETANAIASFEAKYPGWKVEHIQPGGYDETKDFDSLTLEDLQKAAAFRGGECLATEIVDMYTPVKWKSARGNEFEMSPNLVLRGGHWCPAELPWPWDYDKEASINPFFAQVWYPLHSKDQNYFYGKEIFDNFKEKVTE